MRLPISYRAINLSSRAFWCLLLCSSWFYQNNYYIILKIYYKFFKYIFYIFKYIFNNLKKIIFKYFFVGHDINFFLSIKYLSLIFSRVFFINRYFSSALLSNWSIFPKSIEMIVRTKNKQLYLSHQVIEVVWWLF